MKTCAGGGTLRWPPHRPARLGEPPCTWWLAGSAPPGRCPPCDGMRAKQGGGAPLRLLLVVSCTRAHHWCAVKEGHSALPRTQKTVGARASLLVPPPPIAPTPSLPPHQAAMVVVQPTLGRSAPSPARGYDAAPSAPPLPPEYAFDAPAAAPGGRASSPEFVAPAAPLVRARRAARRPPPEAPVAARAAPPPPLTPAQPLVAFYNLWKLTTGTLSLDLKRPSVRSGVAPSDSLLRVRPLAPPTARRPSFTPDFLSRPQQHATKHHQRDKSPSSTMPSRQHKSAHQNRASRPRTHPHANQPHRPHKHTVCAPRSHHRRTLHKN